MSNLTRRHMFQALGLAAAGLALPIVARGDEANNAAQPLGSAQSGAWTKVG